MEQFRIIKGLSSDVFSHVSHGHADCNHFCSADACFLQDLSWSCPQSTRLSMCSSSSSQVITPGVESGGTNPSHCAQFGYAPTSLHISSHMPASLLCRAARFFKSTVKHALSSTFES